MDNLEHALEAMIEAGIRFNETIGYYNAELALLDGDCVIHTIDSVTTQGEYDQRSTFARHILELTSALAESSADQWEVEQ
jgi:hypothetical protein